MINPDAAAIERGVHVKNEGERPIWLQVTARGVPKDPQPAAEAGLSVERSYYTLDGKKADLAKVRQNDRLVVSIDGLQLRTAATTRWRCSTCCRPASRSNRW